MSENILKTEQQIIFKQAKVVESVTSLACKLSDIVSLGAKVDNIEYLKQAEGVSYKAKIIFNVVYLLEGEIRRKEFGIELTDLYKADLEDTAKISVDMVVEGVSAKKGENLSLQAVVNATIICESAKQENFIDNIEGALSRVQEKEITQLKAVVKNSFVIDDELEISKPLKNVLTSGATAQIIACQCGLGSIICDGEIVLSLALLPNEEKSDIIKETRIIPFRLELEESNVSINDISFAQVKVNNLSIKVVVEEDSNKTRLCSQIEIILDAKAYKIVNVCYADDMFSLTNELSLAKENISLKSFVKQKSISQKINGKAFCIPPDNSRIVCSLEERVYGIAYKLENNKVSLEGVASCYIAFEDINSGAICSKLAEMPFELEFEVDGQIDNLSAICKGLQAKIRSDEIELEGELLISYNTYNEQNILAITAVEQGEEISKDNSAFCIYCPKKEDTLWDIAKALRVSEQEILEQNKLDFPLSGQEKIIIYKKA